VEELLRREYIREMGQVPPFSQRRGKGVEGDFKGVPLTDHSHVDTPLPAPRWDLFVPFEKKRNP